MIKSVIIWVFRRADFVDWKIQDSQFSNTSMLCFIKLVYLINKMYWCRDLSFYLAFYVSCWLLLICLFSSGQTMVWRRCAGTNGIGQRTIPGVTRGSLELAWEIYCSSTNAFHINRHLLYRILSCWMICLGSSLYNLDNKNLAAFQEVKAMYLNNIFKLDWPLIWYWEKFIQSAIIFKRKLVFKLNLKCYIHKIWT